MSHAANLRAHQHAAASSAAKRRKLSDQNNSTQPSANGINGLESFSVRPTKDAKAAARVGGLGAAARVGHADDDQDMAEHVNGLDDSASESEDSEDDVDAVDDMDEDDEGDEEDVEADDANLDDLNKGRAHTNGVHPEAEANTGDAEDDEPTDEPTFGDLLRAQAPEQIEVPASDPNVALVHTPGGISGALAPPSAASLGTVLTQALRSNDHQLLESCLSVTNLQNIRATIERLPSVHAATLLRRLAERIHRRPGRAGSMMIWVQWTVVAHGGYLASQPSTMKEVRELYRVVKLRATGLQPLLALKGKLDMLSAQVALRQKRTAAPSGNREEDVIYVEDEESSEDDDEPGTARTAKQLNQETMEPSDDEQMANGVSALASEDDDADAGLDEDLEDGADSSDEDAASSDGGLDDEVEFDDSEDEASEGEESRPAKRQRPT